jgi:4-amino-4-deoxy-L-arabinose transferase-like glycosyltransferase
LLYLGTIAVAYGFSRSSYGRLSAAIIAFAFATSAGFAAYAHYLTVDMPLLFWMLAALWAAFTAPALEKRNPNYITISLISLCLMPTRRVRRNGFIRAP